MATNGTGDPEQAAALAMLRMPDGREIELPVMRDADGNQFVDVRKLHPSTGICTFDPGFTSIAACESRITFIDGNKGVLLYRGELRGK